MKLADFKGITPLMAAAKKGDAELVRALLAHGARPDARDKKGRTAFDLSQVPEIGALLSASTRNRKGT